MKPTARLHALGQSLWLDNITRDLLDDGTLARYMRDLSITGLTSNPSIFQKAMASGHAYDGDIAAAAPGMGTEALFIALALMDLKRAAALLRPAHEQSNRMDGWVSMEVSPLLADDTPGTVAAARHIHQQAACANLFVKIPGNAAGLPAIEEATFAGIPINVTLLFSRAQYLAAADAWMRGVERRIAAGLDPAIHSEASLFVSRWDVAVAGQVSPALHNRLGIAVATQAWRAYRELLASPRWARLQAAGAPPQRLLWASTGTMDPDASDVLYVEALAAQGTINTLPDKTLLAFADHGHVGATLPEDGGDSERTLAEFTRAGIDLEALAATLQREGAEAFVKSWHALLAGIEAKRGER